MGADDVVAEGVAYLLVAQYILQVNSYNLNPATMDGDDAVQYAKDMLLAIEDELAEFRKEISWKPWAKGYFFNRDAARKELIDILHFWMNLVLLTMKPGETILEIANDIVSKYDKKRLTNADRQNQGYDGRTNKCPDCGRAMEDGELMSIGGSGFTPQQTQTYRCQCGRMNKMVVTPNAY